VALDTRPIFGKIPAMNHDFLFKQLLRVLFFEFIDLFFPKLARLIDHTYIEFLDKEFFTDLADGDRHEADLIVKVRLLGQEVCFIIHIEHQSTAEANFPRRMFNYFFDIHKKYGLPVYPIVLFSFDSPLREQPDRYEIAVADHQVLSFKYAVVQLNRLNWRDFLRSENPIASALMAKMNIAPEERPKVKLECLRLLATFRLDKAKMELIWGFVESYLRLNAAEQDVFDKEVAQMLPQEKEEILELPNSWIEKGIEKGEVSGERKMAMKVLRRQLGPLTPAIVDRIESLALAQLDELADALLDFKSLDEAEAWLSQRA
jgi:hypothetical protein